MPNGYKKPLNINNHGHSEMDKADEPDNTGLAMNTSGVVTGVFETPPTREVVARTLVSERGFKSLTF